MGRAAKHCGSPGRLETGGPGYSTRSQETGFELPRGDVEAGFKEADHIVEFDWGHSRTASHIPNPNGSLSWWEQDPWGVEGPTLYIEGISPTWGAFSAAPHVQPELRQAPSASPCSREANTATGSSAAASSSRLCWPGERDGRSDASTTGKTITTLQIPSDTLTQKSDSKRMESLRRFEESTIGDEGAPDEALSSMMGFRGQVQSFQHNPVRQSKEPLPGSVHQFGPQHPQPDLSV